MLDSGSEPPPEETIGFHIVHAVRGRTRIRVDSPDRVDDLARAIEDFFRDRPGVTEIRVNRDCQSVIFSYDPDLLRADDLVGLPDGTRDGSWAGLLPASLVSAGTDAGHLAEQALAGVRDSARRLGELWSSLRDAWLPSFLKRQMRSQMRS